MSEERYKLIKENVYTRCHIAEYTGIGLSCPDKEEIELIDYVEELKKQLTTYQILHRDCEVDNLKNISKIEEKETQQKEFIKYLEDEIKLQEEINDIVLATGFEEILQKYKEIIGDDKE